MCPLCSLDAPCVSRVLVPDGSVTDNPSILCEYTLDTFTCSRASFPLHTSNTDPSHQVETTHLFVPSRRCENLDGPLALFGVGSIVPTRMRALDTALFIKPTNIMTPHTTSFRPYKIMRKPRWSLSALRVGSTMLAWLQALDTALLENPYIQPSSFPRLPHLGDAKTDRVP